MASPRGERPLVRLQRLAAVGLLAAGAAILVLRAATSSEVTWIRQHGDAAWITDARPVDASVQQWGRSEVPVVRFVRRFALAQAPERAQLRLRAGRAWRVRANGTLVGSSPDPDPDWRSDRTLDVAPALRAGENELAIEVWNPRGPPLLRARLELPGGALATGMDWGAAREGGPEVPAALPDDTRPHPSAAAGPRPARVAAARAPALLALFAAAWLGWAAAGARLARLGAKLPLLALALVHALWLALFAVKLVSIPLEIGFDARHHLLYVDALAARRAVPLPTDGWSTYHPPLYYATVLALREAAAALAPAVATVAVKSVSFAAGLGQSWLAWGLARALVPGRPALAAVAVLFAGLLPLNVYLSAYVSNEPLHAFWFGLSTLLCVRALARRRARTRDALALGAALGLALLTKMTALVAAALAGPLLLARAALVERARPARIAVLAAAVALPALGLAGWFYARSWGLYGTPFVGNWNLPGPGRTWWSQPGFHTLDYYLGFGEALRLPLFAGFRSFADALYSSFWGDGWIAGVAGVPWRPAHWGWEWAALGYWLALPATAVLAVGLARAARIALGAHGPLRAAWSFVLALAAALAFAMIDLTLVLPYFGQAKAPYLLGLTASLAVVFALGAEACDAALARAGGRAARDAGRALLTLAGAVFALSFLGCAA